MKKKRILKFKKWKTIDVTLIASAIALYMVIAFITKDIIPPIQPIGITISFEFIILFFVAWITESFLKTFVTSLICGLLLLALPGVQASVINPWSFLFDYLLCNLIISISAFFPVEKKNKKSVWKWFIFVSLPFIFIFIFRVISGLLFWGQYQETEGWLSKLSKFWWCIVVDGIITLVDYVFMIVLVPLIFSRLFVLKEKYSDKNKTRKA